MTPPPLKLGILSESPADETALSVLIEAVLQKPFHRVQPSLRARGWPSVIQVLPAILRYLHFETDAQGLVVVVDSDDSPLHTPDHDAPGYFHPRCRMCQLRSTFHKTIKNLPPARGRDRVLRGVGIAVPALEAWYLCGKPHQDAVSESSWAQGLATEHFPYTRAQLKERVYGTSRPSLAYETHRAVEESRRHARDLRRLEYDFPSFAALSRDLRSWPTPNITQPIPTSPPLHTQNPEQATQPIVTSSPLRTRDPERSDGSNS